MPNTDFDERVSAVRHFNRFYTRRIGVLNQGLLQSRYSLTEVRVLYELAHREHSTATDLRETLGLDAGYLSRILQGFKKRAFVQATPSPADRRQSFLKLTARGRKAFGELDARAQEEIGTTLHRLPLRDQNRLVGSMRGIERLLRGDAGPDQPASYLLRPHQPGDMGWVVHRHGVLYAEEYGWDEAFEALVAAIVAKFVQHYDPKRERCWIAERDGENVGSVFLVKHSATVAKLRLLLVEPSARGLGIGRRLVSECVRFARQAGYRKITLWTNSVLHAARHLYEEAGFVLVQERPHYSFGRDLIGQTWDLKL